MRYVVMVVALAVAVATNACEPESTSVGPPEGIVPTQFTRTFSTLQCWSGQVTPANAPCMTYGSASGQMYVDSAQVGFQANNTVRWKLGTHRYECPCYLGGCNTPCSHAAPVVTELTGTYSITADTVTLEFAQSPDPQAGIPNVLKLKTSIPDRVPTDWAGPDSLTYGRVFAAVILRSP